MIFKIGWGTKCPSAIAASMTATQRLQPPSPYYENHMAAKKGLLIED